MIAIIIILSVVVPMLEVLIFAALYDLAGWLTIAVPSLVTSVIGLVILIRNIPKFMTESVTRDKFATFPTMQSYFDATRVISGVLLLIPGFITDVAGLIILLPRFRGLSFIILSRLTSSRKERIVVVNRNDAEDKQG